jgi:thiol-disulfide isomerase/thioredoxin
MKEDWTKEAVSDLLSGLLGAIVIAFACKTAHVYEDLRSFALTTILVLGIVGFLQGKALRLPLPFKVLLVALPLMSMLVIGPSGTRFRVRAIIMFIGLFAVFVGIMLRRVYLTHQRRGVIYAVAALAAIFLVTYFGAPRLARRMLTRTEVRPARPFIVTSLRGNELDSAQLKGKVVVLDFWATWCPPCRQEMPEVEKLYQRYKSNKDVAFLAVDVKEGDETPEKAEAFVKRAGYNFPVAFDTHDAQTVLQVNGFPTLMLLDKAGRIRLQHMGYDDAEPFVADLSNNIDDLLSE